MMLRFVCLFLISIISVYGQEGEDSFVEVEGIGKPPPGPVSPRNKLMAKRASQVIALRDLKVALLKMGGWNEGEFVGVEMLMRFYKKSPTTVDAAGIARTRLSLSKRQILQHYASLWNEAQMLRDSKKQEDMEKDKLRLENIKLQEKLNEMEQGIENHNREKEELLNRLEECRMELDKREEAFSEQLKVLEEQRYKRETEIDKLKMNFEEERVRFKMVYIEKQQEIEQLRETLAHHKEKSEKELFDYKKEFNAKLDKLRTRFSPKENTNVDETFGDKEFKLQMKFAVESLLMELKQIKEEVHSLKQDVKELRKSSHNADKKD